MNWPVSLLIAVLSGVVGLFAGGFVMNACVRWYRVSSFEGASGYAVMGVALLGGVAGLVLGLVTARMVTGEGALGFFRALACAWGVVIGIALAAAWIAWALADIPPEIDGCELMLEIEYRLPAEVKVSPAKGAGESYLELHSLANHTSRKRERGELRPADARLEGGRWVVPGAVHIFTTRGVLVIDVQLHGEQMVGFKLPVRGRPGRQYLEWSEWGPRPPAPNPPWPDTKPSYRFRVKPIEPPPPGPTAEEIAAQDAAEEDARFAAMDAGATVEAWIPWTRYGVSDAHKAAALAHVVSRATFVEEMSALIDAEDPEVASEALRLVEHLPDLPEAIVKPVAGVGRSIAARIRRVNETTVEEDPSYERAADVSQRFSAWMCAVRTLRERLGADFTPELREILELARVRSDSRAMRGDVLRVASFYMHEWTGLAPLPTDPPPR